MRLPKLRFQHDSYLQQHVCVRWCHHLCLVRSSRRVDCVEATRFLSATGVGLLIAVASATFVCAHKGLAGFVLESNMTAYCSNTTAHVGVTIFALCTVLMLQHRATAVQRNFFSSVGAWRLHPALSIDWHTLLEARLTLCRVYELPGTHSSLEEDPVIHFVVLWNLQEDEGMLRETLENLCRSPFGRETQAYCVAMEGLEGLTLKTKLSVSWRQLATTPRT